MLCLLAVAGGKGRGRREGWRGESAERRCCECVLWCYLKASSKTPSNLACCMYMHERLTALAAPLLHKAAHSALVAGAVSTAAHCTHQC